MRPRAGQRAARAPVTGAADAVTKRPGSARGGTGAPVSGEGRQTLRARSLALFVFSQANSGRPKWPYAAVAR